MRLITAFIAGALLGVPLLICGIALSLWLLPSGQATSIPDVAAIEKYISLQSFLMLPLLAAGVGWISGVIGVRWRGIAGAIAVLPVSMVFVSGNLGDSRYLLIAGVSVILSGLSARLAAAGIPQTEGLSPRRRGPASGPRPSAFLRRKARPSARRRLA